MSCCSCWYLSSVQARMMLFSCGGGCTNYRLKGKDRIEREFDFYELLSNTYSIYQYRYRTVSFTVT